MKVQKRSHFGWGAPRVARSECKKGTVVHYDSADQGLAEKKHSACESYWEDVRTFHTRPTSLGGRGWSDIGYSYGVCPHGFVMEGRGFGFVQAAQPGGNSTWTSVTFMSGKTEKPTAAQVAAYRELRSWLRSQGVAAGERPHSDFVSTSCPGPILSAMIKNGSLRGAPSSAPAPARPSKTAPAFPLPTGHWFGTPSLSPRNHSGYAARDRPHIARIRARLIERGWTVGSGDRFDKDVATVIRKFQAQKNLTVDGLVGARTWRALWESPVT